MSHLTHRDFRRRSATLHDLYSIVDLETFPVRVLTVFSRLIPAEICAYNEVNPTARRLSATLHPPESFDAFSDGLSIFAQHLHEHPPITYVQRTGDGRAMKISDFLTDRQFHDLGLYHEFYRKLDVEHQIAIVLPSPPPVVLGIALSRGRGDFSERERQLLDLLRPHFVRAHRNAAAVTQLRKELAQLKHGLEESAAGFILTDSEGQVRLMTTRARQWVEEYCGRARNAHTRCLPETLQRWVARQETLLNHNDDAPPPRLPFILERAGKKLMIRLFTDPQYGGRMLLLHEEQINISPQALTPLGLTRREAEVWFWVMQGKTNMEAATILNIRPRTVHKHLERIYQKLGVETRMAAAHQALEALGLLRR
jgi:DNA-binding CsgD family transcriptional regulator